MARSRLANRKTKPEPNSAIVRRRSDLRATLLFRAKSVAVETASANIAMRLLLKIRQASADSVAIAARAREYPGSRA